MRLRDIIIGTTLCLVAFGSGIVLGLYSAPQTEPIVMVAEGSTEEAETTPSQAPSQASLPKEEPEKEALTQYLLTLSDDGIHVYEMLANGKTSFLYKTETDVAQLRQEDYQKLCRGIVVSSKEEVMALTEDFGS